MARSPDVGQGADRDAAVTEDRRVICPPLVLRSEPLTRPDSGRTMAGLIHFVRSSGIQAGAKVLFIHTGGGPALFAYQNKMAAEMETLSSL